MDISGHAEKQYKNTAENLENRISIYNFEKDKENGWPFWFFKHLDIKEGQNILELGCGTASLWATNKNNLPQNINVTLSDFSPAMIEKARESLGNIIGFNFELFDVQKMPYNEEIFDKVIAAHMLYHVPDIDLAIENAKKILKQKGIFYSSGPSLDNLKELKDLAFNFDNLLHFPPVAFERFSAETGVEYIKRHFEEQDIKAYIYNNILEITESEAIYNYFKTLLGSEGNSIEEKLLDFKEYCEKKIKRDGAIVATCKAGLFEAIKN